MTKTKKKVAIAEVQKELAVDVKESETTFGWLMAKWAQFEVWFHTKYLPGLKTRLVLYAGFIGSTAATLQQYLTGLPLDKFVSSETLAIIGMGLALLALWFRGMGDRVEKRIEDAE